MALAQPERLKEVLARRAHVEGILCGHVHRAIFRRWMGMTELTAPTFSHQFQADVRPAAPLRPSPGGAGFALYRWSSDSGLLTFVMSID